jgi:hypothetical protein
MKTYHQKMGGASIQGFVPSLEGFHMINSEDEGIRSHNKSKGDSPKSMPFT